MIYIYIYICAVELLSGPRLGFLLTNWATFVFLKRLLVKKHYKIGVSAVFFQQKKGTPNF